jgi:hypothetical protein
MSDHPKVYPPRSRASAIPHSSRSGKDLARGNPAGLPRPAGPFCTRTSTYSEARESCVQLLCKRVEQLHQAGKNVSPAVRLALSELGQRRFRGRGLAPAPQTLRAAYYRWKSSGRAASALALNYRRSPVTSRHLAALVGCCAVAGVDSFRMAGRLCDFQGEFTARAVIAALPAPIRRKIKELFHRRRNKERQLALAVKRLQGLARRTQRADQLRAEDVKLIADSLLARK